MSDTTSQELFTIVVKHIRKQGGPGYDRVTNTCRYRAPDGCGCAASPFIVFYRPVLETKRFWQIASRFPEAVDTRTAGHEAFVSELQTMHDNAAGAAYGDKKCFMRLWNNAVVEFAQRWKLHVPPAVAMGALT